VGFSIQQQMSDLETSGEGNNYHLETHDKVVSRSNFVSFRFETAINKKVENNIIVHYCTQIKDIT